MPHTSHRIDIVVAPADPEILIDELALDGLLRSWVAEGLLAGDRAGDDVDGLVPGGFARLWLDQPGRMVLYANQQGGFRVACPETGENIAAEFGAALTRWRAGAPRRLACPSCGAQHALEGCDLAPPGVFGTSALVFSDVGAAVLTEHADRGLAQAIGPVRTVVRRTF